MNKQTKMRDIAEALGFSTVTVSKALSGKDGVSDAARKKIKDKASEMGYLYNPNDKAINSELTYNIGIIVAERFFDGNSFYMDLYKNILIELNKTNYSAIMEIIADTDERECIPPGIITNSKIDGIILLGQINRNYWQIFEKNNIPFVFLDFYDDDYDISSIVNDNAYGTYLLTNHLIAKGHTDIAFVGSIKATSSILDRYMGYLKSLIYHGIDVRKDYLIEDRDEKGSYIDFVFPEKMPTAFVCNNDEVAYHLVNHLKHLNFNVPKDVSVVGFDDYIFALICNPKLTTFKVDMNVMGEQAARSIIGAIEKPNYVHGRKVVSGRMVLRESVAEPMGQVITPQTLL
jgi:LacI family transcriptional regulator